MWWFRNLRGPAAERIYLLLIDSFPWAWPSWVWGSSMQKVGVRKRLLSLHDLPSWKEVAEWNPSGWEQRAEQSLQVRTFKGCKVAAEKCWEWGISAEKKTFLGTITFYWVQGHVCWRLSERQEVWEKLFWGILVFCCKVTAAEAWSMHGRNA